MVIEKTFLLKVGNSLIEDQGEWKFTVSYSDSPNIRHPSGLGVLEVSGGLYLDLGEGRQIKADSLRAYISQMQDKRRYAFLDEEERLSFITKEMHTISNWSYKSHVWEEVSFEAHV